MFIINLAHTYIAHLNFILCYLYIYLLRVYVIQEPLTKGQATGRVYKGQQNLLLSYYKVGT